MSLLNGGHHYVSPHPPYWRPSFSLRHLDSFVESKEVYYSQSLWVMQGKSGEAQNFCCWFQTIFTVVGKKSAENVSQTNKVSKSSA